MKVLKVKNIEIDYHLDQNILSAFFFSFCIKSNRGILKQKKLIYLKSAAFKFALNQILQPLDPQERKISLWKA